MRLETERAFKRRVRRDAKRQEKIDLAPAAKLKPRSKTIRYDNLKSAMAEEGLLGQILREPALLDRVQLEPEEFSCELLGRVYGLLRSRFREGLLVILSCLQDLTPEEAAHLAGVLSGRRDLGRRRPWWIALPPSAGSIVWRRPPARKDCWPSGTPCGETHKPATHAAWREYL